MSILICFSFCIYLASVSHKSSEYLKVILTQSQNADDIFESVSPIYREDIIFVRAINEFCNKHIFGNTFSKLAEVMSKCGFN